MLNHVVSTVLERANTRLARSVLPGLALTTAATGLAYLISHYVKALNPTSVAVLLGVVVANAGLHRPAVRPGTQFAGKRLLRIAVVLLGLQLSLPELAHLGVAGLAIVLATVGITFTGTRWLGRRLGLSPARSLLIATGFSICGASAVAAMEPVAAGDEEDTAIAIALVTLCGSLAILVLPLLRVPLGLNPVDFGSWAGASVHDVGQTVATAQRVPGSLTTAVIVKLTRVVLLAPLVFGVALSARRHVGSGTETDSDADTQAAAQAKGHRDNQAEMHPAAKLPPPMPLFVAGFLASVVLTSTGILPAGLLSTAKSVQTGLLVAALFGLGTGIHLRTLMRSGGRALVLGLTSWLLIASVAYLGVRLAGL